MTGRTGPSVGRIDIFHQLLDYVIKSYFPQVGWHTQPHIVTTPQKSSRIVQYW